MQNHKTVPEKITKAKLKWWSTCPASMKPLVQTPVPHKKKELDYTNASKKWLWKSNSDLHKQWTWPWLVWLPWPGPLNHLLTILSKLTTELPFPIGSVHEKLGKYNLTILTHSLKCVFKKAPSNGGTPIFNSMLALVTAQCFLNGKTAIV
jgi:hypothetical protein